MQIEQIAPCGIDCNNCDAYIATLTGNTELRLKLAENYLAQYYKEIDPETLYCDACSSEGRHIGFCAECEIRACAFGKGYSTCAECSEFPCEKGSFIWTESSKSRAKLEELKQKQEY